VLLLGEPVVEVGDDGEEVHIVVLIPLAKQE